MRKKLFENIKFETPEYAMASSHTHNTNGERTSEGMLIVM